MLSRLQVAFCLLVLVFLQVNGQYYGYNGYYNSYGPQRYGNYYSNYPSMNYHYNMPSYSSYNYPSSYASPYYGYDMSYSRPMASMGYPSSNMRVGNDLAAIYLTCSTCGRGK